MSDTLSAVLLKAEWNGIGRAKKVRS